MKIKLSKNLFGFFVMFLYLMLGILFILNYSVWQDVPSISLSLFGVVIIAYGLFRGYRSYKAIQIENNEQDEIE
jgi:predicted negative regulator of RcsB-dependent stress response